MLIKGRCGLVVNCCRRDSGEINCGVTPGKCILKNSTSFSLEFSSVEKWADGAKRVHVNDLSGDGNAMNMNSRPGQICKWFGEMRNWLSSDGSMWNSHQRVSI